MGRILLLLEDKEKRRLLSEWLATRYQLFAPDSDLEAEQADFLEEQSFDLCILDTRSLDRHWKWVQAKRETEQPLFLPFLVITSQQDVGMVTPHLCHIDDLITKQIEKVELQTQVEILLRSRQMSLQLKAANEKLQSEIPERQRIELALTKSEAKFQALVQNSSDVIMVLNADGTVAYASPCSPSILGLSPEEIEGKNLFDFVHPEDVLTAVTSFKASLNNPGETQTSEYRFCHKNNLWLYLESKSYFPGTDQNLNGVVVNSRDVTNRKQAEAEIRSALLQAQQLNELKSRFVSMVSHEFRNPLNSILASTQILERYSEEWSQKKKQEFFERIKIGVKKMTELLDDVLVIGEAEGGELEVKLAPFDLENFSRNLVEEMKLSTDTQHAIAFVSEGQSTNACLDKKLLGYILTNLLSNAIKYSPQGSTVNFKLTYHDREVIFQIKDQGIGIPPEDMGRLFESFHRASNVKNIPGTGLGLAIVKRCVDLQGGKITVVSEVRNTTFTVTLPLDSQLLTETNAINSGVSNFDG